MLPRLPLLWSPRGIPKLRLSFPCSREWLRSGVMRMGELARSSWSLIYSSNVELAVFQSTTTLTKYVTVFPPERIFTDQTSRSNFSRTLGNKPKTIKQKKKQDTFLNTTFTLTKCTTLVFHGYTHTKIQTHLLSKTFTLTKIEQLSSQDTCTLTKHRSPILREHKLTICRAVTFQGTFMPVCTQIILPNTFTFSKRRLLIFLAHMHTNVQSSSS